MKSLIPLSRTDAAVAAWGEALRQIAAAEPRMLQYTGRHDTYMVFTGSPADSTNGVFTFGRSPDPVEIDQLADRAAATALTFTEPVPWCIQVRGRADDRIRAVADRHGLIQSSWEPFLIRDLHTPGPRRDTGPVPQVLALAGAEFDGYVRALSTGFEAPQEMFASLFTARVMDAPGITAYVAEVDGQPVATAMTILTEDHIGVFNVSTAPDHRRRGYGAALTEEIVSRGRAAGAETAYLRSTDMALPLYESLGFKVAEHWTYLTAA
ncbi:GNAT family N-acetyltransferase [Streptomyces sp. S.PB5]|uniref:GNAT family N-acetyltransferase n=1 Tax=Streptomyces sp. S.PB5 TaxID=3020844 RepID=UPI0025B0F61B|nr:GNAT family N-acetyltransferase [Streptomyces sp. S.PB5]MDN3027038.1 GNAT family N-acetyltransferase [Streptomyces sp. S.PB5]